MSDSNVIVFPRAAAMLECQEAGQIFGEAAIELEQLASEAHSMTVEELRARIREITLAAVVLAARVGPA